MTIDTSANKADTFRDDTERTMGQLNYGCSFSDDSTYLGIDCYHDDGENDENMEKETELL